MQLSDRSIHKLCQVLKWTGSVQQPMIWPYVDHKEVHPCGFSYGLSSSSYDLRIAHDLFLPANPVYRLAELIRIRGYMSEQGSVGDWLNELRTAGAQSQLAHTLEWITIPDNVVGYVVDKSSYARVFVSAMNTLFDPGFQGHGVLEMVNLSDAPIFIQAGQPICQMAFHWLDKKTKKPYRGKYQGQVGVQGTRLERPDGSWTPAR